MTSKFRNDIHLVLVVSTPRFKSMGPAYQYSGLVCLCNNSDKILALSLQQRN